MSRDGASVPSTQAVLRREIPWETYMTARLLSDKDLQLIRKIDKRSAAAQETLLEEDGSAYVETLLTVLRNVTKEETVQYVLALLDEIISADPGRARFFHQRQGLAGVPDPYTIFLRLLQRNDWFTQEKACRLLTAILGARPDKSVSNGSSGAGGSSARGAATVSAADEGVHATQVAFVEWLCTQLRRPTNSQRSVPTAAAALGSLLRESAVRQLFTRAGGISLLAPLLRGAVVSPGSQPPNQQLLYDVGLALWQLSYHLPAAELMPTQGVLNGLVGLVRGGVKEKVVRVGLLALRNLLSAPGLDVAPDLLEADLHKVVAIRSSQNWEDEDVPTLLTWMEEELRGHIQTLSSFEVYKKELLSGSLDWTPMHTSDQFWRENIGKFEEKDFQVLRVLLKLLEASREAKTLAVGCHDVGQFITHFPAGKGIVTGLKGKDTVLRLVGHPEPMVQKQALLASQKILLSRDKADFLAHLDSGLA